MRYYEQTANESATTAYSGLAPDTDLPYPVPAVDVSRSDAIASTHVDDAHGLERVTSAITATPARPADSLQKIAVIPANPHGIRGF